MTERLYYKNPDLLAFEGTIVQSGTDEGRDYVELDRSAFYPTSGGQLYDTGFLNGVEVLEVLETDQGEVRHYTAKTVGQTGDRVSGEVDSGRRWRHRQQHTAQHIISQLCINQLEAETVSVHLGESYGAVELDIEDISDEAVDQIELSANLLLRENLPVEILFVSSEEARRLPLRKMPEREGSIRIIRTGDLDWSACGGTHCRTTAQIGLIKLVGREKARGHVLLKFLVGTQALEDYRKRYKVLESLAQGLTCHYSDLTGKVEKLTEQVKSQRQEITKLNKLVLPLRAEEIAGRAETHGDVKLVCTQLDSSDSDLAMPLLSEVAERINGIAAAVLPGRMVIATGKGSRQHAGTLAKALAKRCGLRGGGGANAAQLGGAETEKLEDYRRTLGEVIDNA